MSTSVFSELFPDGWPLGSSCPLRVSLRGCGCCACAALSTSEPKIAGRWGSSWAVFWFSGRPSWFNLIQGQSSRSALQPSLFSVMCTTHTRTLEALSGPCSEQLHSSDAWPASFLFFYHTSRVGSLSRQSPLVPVVTALKAERAPVLFVKMDWSSC